MREKWNAAALRKHCQKNHEVLFVCQAEDKVGKNRREPTLEEMTIIAGVDPEEELRKLHTRIEIAIGMKAMVTVNIATEANLANGTRGIITDIILDPREILERSEAEDGVVTLVHPLVMIVFKPLVSLFPKFGGLAEGEIPLFPAEYMFKINTSAIQKVLVNRRQYNLTGGYAFTLYKTQGQTLESVVVDIRRPPPPVNLDSFGAYVAASRSKGRETIRFLGDFNDALFTSHSPDDLRQEDDRLAMKTKETKEAWDHGLFLGVWT